MGDRVGFSPLVVIVAMILWGWILGTIGLVLSVSLVAAVKIVPGAYAPARWAAVLLGNYSPKVAGGAVAGASGSVPAAPSSSSGDASKKS